FDTSSTVRFRSPLFTLPPRVRSRRFRHPHPHRSLRQPLSVALDLHPTAGLVGASLLLPTVPPPPTPTTALFLTTHTAPFPRRNVRAVVPIIRLSVGKRSDVDQGETTLTIELTLAIAIWLGIGADQHLAREDEMRLFPCALIAAASLVVSGGVGV